MNNKDIIQRFVFGNANVRGEIVRLEHSFQTIMEQHQYPALIQQLLGQFLVVSALLSAIIKFKGRLTVQLQSSHALRLLLAQCTDDFHLRGLAQWKENLTEDNLLSELKKGTLVISVNSNARNQRYQGVVAWQGDSIAQTIEGYFKNSEQLPTRLWLAINETTAAGLLLQALPNDSASSMTSEKEQHSAEEWEHLTCLAGTLTSEELLTLENENLLYRLFSQEEVRLFESAPVIFYCECSVKRSENAILLLGREEAEEELKDKQAISVTCEFCNKTYTFDRVDVENIFKTGDSSSSKQMH